MALGHAVPRRVVAVARIERDVVGAHHALAGEGGCEDRGIARHGKALERRARHAGQRVEHIALARLVQHIVEEGAELGAGQRHAGVGHGLDDLFEVEVGGDCGPGLVDDLERGGLAAKRILRAFLLGDVDDRTDQPLAPLGRRLDAAACHHATRLPPARHAILGLIGAVRIERVLDTAHHLVAIFGGDAVDEPRERHAVDGIFLGDAEQFGERA